MDRYRSLRKRVMETSPELRYKGEDFNEWKLRAYSRLNQLLGLYMMVKPQNDRFQIDWGKKKRRIYRDQVFIY